MSRANFHTHSRYCDGEGELEAYVLEAIKRDMCAIGFLKETYREIPIYAGLEVDYIPGLIGPGVYADRNLDVLIGSVHFISDRNNGLQYGIDNTMEEFERALVTGFKNNIKELVARYYELVVEMMIIDPPHIIGHLDVIKKLNVHNRYFDEEEQWYQDLIDDVIDATSRSDCILELNTRGYYKSITSDFYPGKQILKKCLEAGIPLTISSDAHHPHEIDSNFEDAAALLIEIGYQHIYLYEKGNWLEKPVKDLSS